MHFPSHSISTHKLMPLIVYASVTHSIYNPMLCTRKNIDHCFESKSSPIPLVRCTSQNIFIMQNVYCVCLHIQNTPAHMWYVCTLFSQCEHRFVRVYDTGRALFYEVGSDIAGCRGIIVIAGQSAISLITQLVYRK